MSSIRQRVQNGHSNTQAVLFNPDGKFDTLRKQRLWLQRYNLHPIKPRVKHLHGKYWRWRIRDPIPGVRKRIEHIDPGNVELVIQFPYEKE